MCKKGVKIVNVGRGGLIQEKDLYDALESGQVSRKLKFLAYIYLCTIIMLKYNT